jgi:hypothetical protein
MISFEQPLMINAGLTIIHEQKRSIFLVNTRAFSSEYGYNINGLTLTARLILKIKIRAKRLGFSVNIEYSSKSARYSQSGQPYFFNNPSNFNKVELKQTSHSNRKNKPSSIVALSRF